MERCLPALVALIACWCFVMTIAHDASEAGPAAAQEGTFATGNQPAVDPVQIDAKRTMGYLTDICAIGPRQSATDGMKKQQDLIKAHFTKLGADVQMQEFKGKQISQPKAVDMANMIISWQPKSKKRVIICSHYDTRPIADQEKDPKNWTKPFVSANDGGSGVALMMELGNHIKKLKLEVGVDFVLFDGEEYIFNSETDQYFFGSKHFADKWVKDGKQPQYEGAVLLDMIAGKNPKFPVEGYSLDKAQPLALKIWDIAKKQGCNAFLQKKGDYVQDDHLALQKVGIPAIDIIDFSYPHWHRLTDTPASCDPSGIEQVTRVLSIWVQTVK